MSPSLQLNTFLVFNLSFPSNTKLSCFFLFFFFIDLYFLIPADITQSFTPTAEVAVLIQLPINEVKTEIETHPVIPEAKINDC